MQRGHTVVSPRGCGRRERKGRGGRKLLDHPPRAHSAACPARRLFAARKKNNVHTEKPNDRREETWLRKAVRDRDAPPRPAVSRRRPAPQLRASRSLLRATSRAFRHRGALAPGGVRRVPASSRRRPSTSLSVCATQRAAWQPQQSLPFARPEAPRGAPEPDCPTEAAGGKRRLGAAAAGRLVTQVASLGPSGPLRDLTQPRAATSKERLERPLRGAAGREGRARGARAARAGGEGGRERGVEGERGMEDRGAHRRNCRSAGDRKSVV